MKKKKIRTRYAPSPTGYLHIGGARTALFSYLFAKHYNGEFIVRIEDTDEIRNIKDGEKSQLENLKWLGIIPDESPEKPNPKYGPYRQSEKLEKYNLLIDKLIEKKKAYIAYDSPEEITQQKKEQKLKGKHSFRYDKNWLKISQQEQKIRKEKGQYSVRLKLDSDYLYSWDDLVRGHIEINTKDIGDFIIKKQNGYPTYNFAVVVDDYDMEISHVLRGEEHITNTPKQLAIYKAFDWHFPKFGHLTIITNLDGKKLSKRDQTIKQFIEDYKNEGYANQAIFNFLTLLGWTHPQAKEKMDKEEIIKTFDFRRLSKSPTKFDIQKMQWFGKEYIQNMTNESIKKQINFDNKSNLWIEIFIDAYKQSSHSIQQLEKNLQIYKDISSSSIKKNSIIETFAKELSKNTFNIDGIQNAINTTKKITGEKGKKLFMPIRNITTNQEHGPELAKAIFLVGENLVKERIK